MNDKLEPIRAVFREACLYNHAADDLLCQRLAEAVKPQAEPVPWQSVMESLVRHIERETCTHEETYRGGAIWEICRGCGAQWADDEGGKPEFKWPECVETARAMLADAPKALPQPQASHLGRWFCDGPNGHFWSDDLETARRLVNMIDKDDDWTVTEVPQPSPQAARYAVAQGDGMDEDGVRDTMTGLVVSADEVVAMLNAAPQPQASAEASREDVARLLELSDRHLTNGEHAIERGRVYWNAQAQVAIEALRAAPGVSK